MEKEERKYIVYLEVDVSVLASSSAQAGALVKGLLSIVAFSKLINVDDVRVWFIEKETDRASRS